MTVANGRSWIYWHYWSRCDKSIIMYASAYVFVFICNFLQQKTANAIYTTLSIAEESRYACILLSRFCLWIATDVRISPEVCSPASICHTWSCRCDFSSPKPSRWRLAFRWYQLNPAGKAAQFIPWILEHRWSRVDRNTSKKLRLSPIISFNIRWRKKEVTLVRKVIYLPFLCVINHSSLSHTQKLFIFKERRDMSL